MNIKTVCDQEFWVQVANDYPEKQVGGQSPYICDQSNDFRNAWCDYEERCLIRSLANEYGVDTNPSSNFLFTPKYNTVDSHKQRRDFIDWCITRLDSENEKVKTWERFKTWVKNL